MAAGANANLGNNIPIPAPPAAGGGTETPLPAQFAGNAQGVAGLSNVGINPAMLGNPIVNPVLTPIQQAAYTNNYDTAMNQQQGALTPFMQAIAGQLGGTAGVGADSMTMQEMANYFPQFNQNAMGLANSQQSFSNSLDASALGAAINRLLTANQYTSGGGGGGAGAGTGAGSGLPGFNGGQVTGLGNLGGSATSPANAAGDAANLAADAAANTGAPNPIAAAAGQAAEAAEGLPYDPNSLYVDPASGQLMYVNPNNPNDPFLAPVGTPPPSGAGDFSSGPLNQGTPDQGGGVQYSSPTYDNTEGGMGGNLPVNQPYQLPPASALGAPDQGISGGFNGVGGDAGGAFSNPGYSGGCGGADSYSCSGCGGGYP